MSCVCEPCKKIIRIKCGAEPYLAENVCQYPDAYMVDFEVSMGSACNCLVENSVFSQDGYVRCCDRRQRTIDTVNGTYLLERIDPKTACNSLVWNQPNLGTYQFKNFNNTTDYYSDICIVFQIYKPSNSFPCSPICYAAFSFPSYTLPCNPNWIIPNSPNISFIPPQAVMSTAYAGYQIPDTCNSPFVLQYEGAVDVYTGIGPCLTPPATVTFTPVLGA